jgi:hypothetical protein
VLLTAFVFYGWRYGFTPLPEVVPGVELKAAPQPPGSTLSTNNIWHWVGELNQASPSRGTDVLKLYPLVMLWTGFGPSAITNWEELDQALARRIALAACFRAALQCTETAKAVRGWGYREELLRGSLSPSSLAGSGVELLVIYPFYLAAQAEKHHDGRAAFGHLIEAQVIHQLLYPNLRFASSHAERVALAWRRLALTGPAVSPAEGRDLLDQLAATTNGLPSLEAVVLFDDERLRAGVGSLGFSDNPWPWSHFLWEVREAFGNMVTETRDAFGWLVGRVFQGSTEEAPELLGARHLLSPLSMLWEMLPRKAARDQDFDQVRRAYLSQVLAQLKAGRIEEAVRVADRLRERWTRRGWLSRLVDRPAVWSTLGAYLPPRFYLVNWKTRRVLLESCRLALALRLYKDLHGDWPQRLDQLVPEILASVPPDPFSSQRFLYQHASNSWAFWSVGPHGVVAPDLAKPPDDVGMPPTPGRFVFDSAEAERNAALWQERQQMIVRFRTTPSGQGGVPPAMMVPRMLQRYGLLPTVRFSAPPAPPPSGGPAPAPSNPAPASAVAALAPLAPK